MITRINKIMRNVLIASLSTLVVGLIVFILLSGGEGEDVFSSTLVNSEIIHLMISLLILLALSLAVLAAGTIVFSKLLWRYDAKKTGRVRRNEGDRFSMLCELDKEFESYRAPKYEKERSLSRICDDFRNYAASELGLYYSIDDIRRFVAGLGVTRLIILQGMSGTGKTSLAYAFGRYIDNPSVVVPVQPMWKERSDIIGYFNEFTKKFNETTLLRKLYEAGYKKELYITVLDEMNISRIEYYFAEFLSLLELPEEKRYLDVVSDVWSTDPVRLVGGKIKLPPNMWFVGTANNDDSTFAISDKVYDRAMVLTLDRKCEPFVAPKRQSSKISYAHFCTLVQEAKTSYRLSERQEKNIKTLDAYLVDKFRISFGNRIMKQINEYAPIYMACGGSEIEALDDIFSKKVLRKLEAQSPVYVRNEAPALAKLLDDLFGQGKMRECLAYLGRFENAV